MTHAVLLHDSVKPPATSLSVSVTMVDARMQHSSDDATTSKNAIQNAGESAPPHLVVLFFRRQESLLQNDCTRS